MKKAILLALLAILIMPAASALLTETDMVTLDSNLVRQGYQFAHIKGVNSNPDTPLDVRHWKAKLEAGPNRARCEMQDNIRLPPGPFDVEIAVQCQTQSGLSTIFPRGLKVTLETFFEDDAPVAFYNPERLTIEAVPHGQRTGFPEGMTGRAVNYNQTNSTGTFLFFAGMGAIVIVAGAVIISSLRQEE